MSSDVYIDLSNNQEYFTDPSADPDAETFRIGNLGQMSYFGFNIVDYFRYLCKLQPIVYNDIILSLDNLSYVFFEYRKKLNKYDNDYFANKFGYEKPDPWDDVPKSGDFDKFKKFVGWRWCIRVD